MPVPSRKAIPRKERAAIFRDAWSGENKHSLNSTPKPHYETLLEGVLYNAMARSQAGKPLSELEQNLVKTALTAVEDPAELVEYGQLFKESKKTHGANMQRLYPNAVLSLDEDQPFTTRDLVDYATEISDEFAALPQNQIVDLAQVQGSYKPSQEYEAAVKEAGNGSLFFDSSAPSLKSGMSNSGELIAKRFYVWDAPGDQSNTKAEIYFTWSAGADNGATKEYKTRTWGSIKDNQGYNFPSDNVIFRGDIEYCMFAFITCWEEDDSGDAWVDALIEGCKNASKSLMEAAADTAKSPGRENKKAAVYQAVAGLVALGLAHLIAKFRNHDDLVGERTIGFTKAALGEFWGRPNDEIGFSVNNKMDDSGVDIYLHGAIHGNDLAKIQYQTSREVDTSSVSATTTSSTILSGSESLFNPPKYVNSSLSAGALSWEGAAMVNFHGDLVACWNHTDSGKIMWSKYNAASDTWSAPVSIGVHRAFGKVAVCMWKDSLWLAYNDTRNNIRLIRTEKNNINSWVGHWDPESLIPGFQMLYEELFPHPGTVIPWFEYLFPGFEWPSFGDNFAGGVIPGLYLSMDLGPAMAASGPHLVLAAKRVGKSQIVYTVGHSGNNEWRTYQQTKDAVSEVAPTLVTVEDTIFLFWVSPTDGHIRYNRFNPNDEMWFSSLDTGLESSGSVGAYCAGGFLFLAYRAKAKDDYSLRSALLIKTGNTLTKIDENPVEGSVAYSGAHVGVFGNRVMVTYGKPT